MSKTSESDVFLTSFRGNDPPFVETLCEFLRDSGICVFKGGDENDIRGPIAEELQRAIAGSKIYIPIFSKNYASSKWRELEEIVKAKREGEGKEILPVFYNVTADDVKLKTREEDETVQPWKSALLSIPVCKDWEQMLTNLKSDEECCREIVKRVSVMLKLKQVRTCECLVGMNEQVKIIMELLDIECLDVQVIVIRGIGGIGKTTVAFVAFDKLWGSFDHCIFLPDIQEYTVRRGGLLELQRKLLRDAGYGYIQVRDSSDARSTIEDKFSARRVLIVLDDIHDADEIGELLGDFGSFGGGSRIIVTTRNILQITGLISSKTCVIEDMKRENALQLFSLHAFGRPSPPPEYYLLSDKVVFELIGGLPLAIEVIGSLLFGKSKEKWHLTIERLEMIGKEKVEEKLKLSYDDLSNEAKEIFLDIACFFVGKDITKPMYIWEACHFYPKMGLEELIAMSLVKIKRNKYLMHDYVRDFGREIVCQEDLMEERSRLWTWHDAEKLLNRGKEGKRSIKSIRLLNETKSSYDRGVTCTIPAEKLGGLNELRFLEINGEIQWDRKWKLQFPKLLWLSWRFRQSDLKGSIMCVKSLVVLNLSGCDITEDWEGWREFKELSHLKVLDLSYCRQLTTTPDLCNCLNLERLVLKSCCRLVKIDESVASLNGLIHLDLRECYSLQGLPKVLCGLVHLEEMMLDQGVSHLPNSVKDSDSRGKMSPFNFKKEGLLSSSRLTELPESIGSLNALEKLSLSRVRISRLPESIGELVKLKRLSMRNCCELKSLPDSIGGLVNLEEFDLGGCSKLISIPSSLTHLVKLQWLDLSDCLALKSLPDCMGYMGLLKVIDISGSGIRKLPSFIKMQKQLEVIRAEGSGLDGVPSEVEMLSCLRVLTLTGTRICGLPSLTQLTSLEELDLGSCDYIEELPMLPASLTCLRVASESLLGIADLSHLTKLKSLSISNKRDEIKAAARGRKPRVELPVFNIEWIGELVELTNLRLTISKITTIPTKFCALSQLKQLTLQYTELQCSLPLPYNLSTLNLSHLKGGSKSLYLSLLKNLKALSLSSCEDLTEIPGLGELESLQSLCIYNCTSLERLDNISKLRKLKSLELTSCSNVRDIHGLWGLESLVKLNIDMCNLLERITAPPLQPCSSTGESKTTAARLDVFISRCDMLKDLRGVEELVSVRSLTIKDCTSLGRLFDVSRWRYVTKLTFHKCVKLREIQGVEELESLKELVIQDCSCLEWLPQLSNLKLLERLHVEKCRNLKAIYGLESAFLKYLHIRYCYSLEKLGIDPHEMNQLEYLCIEFCHSLKEIRNWNNVRLPENNSSEVDQQPQRSSSSTTTTTTTSTSFDQVVASCSSTEAMQTCLFSDDSKAAVAAAKAVLKGFFSGGIEMLASDIVPVMKAAKVLSQVKDQTDVDSFWKEEELCSRLQQASSSYKEILESIKVAEVSHANYAKLKESAVEMRDNYTSVKSKMDSLQTTKEETLSQIDTLRARLVETDQQLETDALERQRLVTAMKEQVRIMKAAYEEMQTLDTQRDASQANFISLKTQWDSWAAQALLLLHPAD